MVLARPLAPSLHPSFSFSSQEMKKFNDNRHTASLWSAGAPTESLKRAKQPTEPVALRAAKVVQQEFCERLFKQACAHS